MDRKRRGPHGPRLLNDGLFSADGIETGQAHGIKGVAGQALQIVVIESALGGDLDRRHGCFFADELLFLSRFLLFLLLF